VLLALPGALLHRLLSFFFFFAMDSFICAVQKKKRNKIIKNVGPNGLCPFVPQGKKI